MGLQLWWDCIQIQPIVTTTTTTTIRILPYSFHQDDDDDDDEDEDNDVFVEFQPIGIPNDETVYKNNKTKKPWRYPSTTIGTRNFKEDTKDDYFHLESSHDDAVDNGNHDNDNDPWILPMGSIIPCPLSSHETFTPNHSTTMLFLRLQLRSNTNRHVLDPQGIMIRLEQKDRIHLWKQQQKQKKWLDTMDTWIIPRNNNEEDNNDDMTNCLPKTWIPYNLSLDWSSSLSLSSETLLSSRKNHSSGWWLWHSLLLEMKRNPYTSIVLNGPTGSGKSFHALVLAALARCKDHRATLYLDCQTLQESSSTSSRNTTTTAMAMTPMTTRDILMELDTIFEKANRTCNCLLLLDNLDRLAPNLIGDNNNDNTNDDPGARIHGVNPTAVDQSKLISDRILHLAESCSSSLSLSTSTLSKKSLCIVMTCSSPLHPSLLYNMYPFHQQRQETIPTLSSNERRQVLQQMMMMMMHMSPKERLPWNNDQCHDDYTVDMDMGTRMEGFRPRDLEKVAARVRRLLDHDHDKHSVSDRNGSFNAALHSTLDQYIPLSHLSLSFSKSSKDTAWNWSEIGGLFHVKAQLEKTILYPSKYRRIYDQAKQVRLPRGILLFGPPGCGKTLLVPALAKKCGFPLVSCKGPELLDKYIGASEAKVRELFQRASAVAPSILFLDELDALAPRRGTDHTGVTDRVVNQLLTFLDGVESTSTVYIVGATSRPDKVDPALLRPGRLEQHLFVGPPDTDEEWVDVFEKLSKHWTFSLECQMYLETKSNCWNLLQTTLQQQHMTHRFSPADMKAVLDTAHLHALHRTLDDKGIPVEQIQGIEITLDDLRIALVNARPCLNAKDGQTLQQVYASFPTTTRSKTEHTMTTAPASPFQETLTWYQKEHALKTTLR